MHRRTLVCFLAIALLAPLVAANQAPVAIGSATPADAVLGQPVVFRDLSTDDGTIVSAEWTFTDGRSVTGSTVTRSFDYPGLHTIELRVTDDGGAVATTQVLVRVHAPLMHGRAFGLSAGAAALADTGDVSTTGSADHSATVGEMERGDLRLAGLDAELRTLGDRTIARADAAFVHVPVPIGFVRITGVQSHVIARCGEAADVHVHVGQIRLNDAPIVPPGEVAAATRFAFPGGEIVLHARHASAPERVGVTAVRILVDGQPPIDLAHAEAGVSSCPW